VHASHAALVERVRADFHRHRLRAGIAQLREQACTCSTSGVVNPVGTTSP
jgi:hypothetical protein